MRRTSGTPACSWTWERAGSGKRTGMRPAEETGRNIERRALRHVPHRPTEEKEPQGIPGNSPNCLRFFAFYGLMIR